MQQSELEKAVIYVLQTSAANAEKRDIYNSLTIPLSLASVGLGLLCGPWVLLAN
jgi:hypothetical protein